MFKEANHIAEGDADSVILQCKKFLEEIVPTHTSLHFSTAKSVNNFSTAATELTTCITACNDTRFHR